MTYLDRIKTALAKAAATWRGFGQIAPLSVGFVAGLSVTLVW